MEKQITIKRDGLLLHGLIDLPEQDEFDLVILMHGFTSNLGYTKRRVFYDLTPALRKKGLGTLRFDFNGHGKSEGSLSEMTIFNELADANAVLNFAQQLKGVRRIYLLGHSQGGVIASLMAAYYPDLVSKLVLMSPAATLIDDARLGSGLTSVRAASMIRTIFPIWLRLNRKLSAASTLEPRSCCHCTISPNTMRVPYVWFMARMIPSLIQLPRFGTMMFTKTAH